MPFYGAKTDKTANAPFQLQFMSSRSQNADSEYDEKQEPSCR